MPDPPHPIEAFINLWCPERACVPRARMKHDLAALVAAVREGEREACARVAEGEILIPVEEIPPGTTQREYGTVLAQQIAAAIRARGEEQGFDR